MAASPADRSGALPFVALVVLNLGGSVPLSVSDLSGRTDPNAAEVALSVEFALVTLALLVVAAVHQQWISPLAFASGALWAVSSAYVLTDTDLGGWERVGVGLIAAGCSLGCFAAWQRFRVGSP
jgi:hypothetical protein